MKLKFVPAVLATMIMLSLQTKAAETATPDQFISTFANVPFVSHLRTPTNH